MALEYGFYNSVMGDRRYNSVQMSEIFEGLITDGVYPSVGDKFAVRPSEGMQVIVGTGRAWFDGTWSKNRTPYPIDIDQADPIFDRIDTICIKVDKNVSARMNSFEVLKGVVSSEPFPVVPPTEELNVFYHPIAYVTVKAHATDISTANIELLVGKSVCPFTTSILQQTDIDELFDQWTAQFIGWWDSIKEILSGDVVGNILGELMNKVDISDKATSNDVFIGTDDTKWVTPNAASYGLMRPGMAVTSYVDLTDSPRFIPMDGNAYSLDFLSSLKGTKYANNNKFKTTNGIPISNVNKVSIDYAVTFDDEVKIYGRKMDPFGDGYTTGYFSLDFYNGTPLRTNEDNRAITFGRTDTVWVGVYNGRLVAAHMNGNWLRIYVDGELKRAMNVNLTFNGKMFGLLHSTINQITGKVIILLKYDAKGTVDGSYINSQLVIAYTQFSVYEMAFNDSVFSYSSIYEPTDAKTVRAADGSIALDPTLTLSKTYTAYDGTYYMVLTYPSYSGTLSSTSYYGKGRCLIQITPNGASTYNSSTATRTSIYSEWSTLTLSETIVFGGPSTLLMYESYKGASGNTVTYYYFYNNLVLHSRSSTNPTYSRDFASGIFPFLISESASEVRLFSIYNGVERTLVVSRTTPFVSGQLTYTSLSNVWELEDGTDVYARDIAPYRDKTLTNERYLLVMMNGFRANLDSEVIHEFSFGLSSISSLGEGLSSLIHFSLDPSTKKFTFITKVPCSYNGDNPYVLPYYLHDNGDGTYCIFGVTKFYDTGAHVEYVPIPLGDENSYFVV